METLSSYQELAIGYLGSGAMKVGAAIAFWIIGRYLIGMIGRLLQQVLQRQKVDPTLMRYLGNILNVALNIALVLSILGYCGIETTSFAALVAGVGIAVGAAWGGLLSNLAAGAFLIVLKPFKVGDFICAGGVTGTVKEIGLFATAIDSPDNVHTVVGNGKIFGDTIQNFSSNPHRRVELKCQLAGSADHVAAMELLRSRMASISNVMTTPAPEVEILDFNLVGPVLAVRPYCHTDHYWQVYFDGNRAIRESLAEAGFPAPMPAQVVLTRTA